MQLLSKILVRCGMLPHQSIDVLDMLKKDRMGSNNGNLIYQYSVIRTLMTEKNEIYADGYIINHNKADEINEKYDAYVIPLADAFRNDFRSNLKSYTALIKKLKIPVYVIGVGLRAPYEPKLQEGFPFDEDVKAFVSAVLNNSQMIGLRGQITSNYLTKLGFKEDTDHKVIGCPSMYTFGRQLKIRDVNLTKDSLVSINASNITKQSAMDFLVTVSEEYKNNYFIPQIYPELFLGYVGGPSIPNTPNDYPKDLSSSFYKEGKVKYFINAPTWFDYMKKVDLSVGTRLHGNITATINGAPNLTIVQDARMRELAEYHNLPSVTADEVSKETNLLTLIEKIDFKSATQVHEERFDNFINFLDKNNIDHIYKENINRKNAPLDILVENEMFAEGISPITSLSQNDVFERISAGVDIQSMKFEKNKTAAVNNVKRQLLRVTNEKKISDKKFEKIQKLVNEKDKITNELNGLQNEIEKLLK